ncbi:MAG: hypothetical protein WC175_02430 [Candidatus Dojkabacteria bacterium]
MFRKYKGVIMFVDFPKIITELAAVPTVFQTATSTVSGFNFFKVFISEKGKDNKIVTFTDPNLFLEEYFGNSKIIFKKHGQHPYDIINILERGGTVHCLRVCPSSINAAEGGGYLPLGLVNKEISIGIDSSIVSNPEADDASPLAKYSDITRPRFILTLPNPTNSHLLIPGNTVKLVIESDDSTDPFGDNEGTILFHIISKALKPSNGIELVGHIDHIETFDNLDGFATSYNTVSATVESTDTAVVRNMAAATLSNGILSFALNVSEADSAVVSPLVVSKNNAEKPEDIKTLIENLENNENALATTTPNYTKSYCFLGFAAEGRGDYYNNLGFDFSTPIADNLERYPFFTYSVSPYQVINGKKQYTGDSFVVSFSPDAIDENGNSLFIGIILERFLSNFNIYYSEVAIENLVKAISEKLGDTENTLNAGNIDFISGLESSIGDAMYSGPLAALQAKIGINKTTEMVVTTEHLSVSEFEVNDSRSVKLSNGSLGSLGSSVYDNAFYEMVNSLYVGAFSGLSTTDIYDAKQFPIDIVLDGNYSTPVKAAMRTLVNNESRKNIAIVLDATNSNFTPEQVKDYFVGKNIDDHRISLYGQSMMISDRFGRKDIRVTSPHFLSAVILRNFRHPEGLGRALAGKTFGKIEGYKSRTLDYTPATPEILKMLFKNKINYIVEDFDGARFMSHSTSQKKEDALSELPNVLLINRLIRILQSDTEDFQFSRNKPEKVEEFKQLLTDHCDAFQIENNYAISAITVDVKQSEYDKIQKIARVNVAVTFYGFIYSIVLSFTVA